MTYKELLRLYKKGELSDEMKAKVKEDIDRQEAISEFLFENDEIPELRESCLEAEIADDNSSVDEKNFQKMIKKSIRKAFIKLGAAVGVILLALLIAANAALPHIADAIYYDPTKITGNTTNNNQINRLSVDTTIYTELFTPGYYRTDAWATGEGYGRYNIQIFQNFSKNGQIKNAYGTIDKGRLTMFDDTVFRLPPQNAFVSEGVKDLLGYDGTGAAGNTETAINKLSSLNSEDYYVTYVTFNEIMSYDELVAWSIENGITPDWCAVCRYQGPEEDNYATHDILGFNYNSYGSEFVYDTEKYPYLNFYDVINSVKTKLIDNVSADVMESHFTSLLRYIIDNKDFCRMAGRQISDDELKMYIHSVENYGLTIYGFVITAQKDKILEISKNENVNYIYTEPLR